MSRGLSYHARPEIRLWLPALRTNTPSDDRAVVGPAVNA
jgi:hypothetical protein